MLFRWILKTEIRKKKYEFFFFVFWIMLLAGRIEFCGGPDVARGPPYSWNASHERASAHAHLSFFDTPPSLNAALSCCNHSRLLKPVHTTRLLPDATTDFGCEINRCIRFLYTLLIHIRSRWSDRGKVVMCGGLYKIPFHSQSFRVRPYHI